MKHPQMGARVPIATQRKAKLMAELKGKYYGQYITELIEKEWAKTTAGEVITVPDMKEEE